MSVATEPYVLLPFRFGHFSGTRMLIVNDAGEFLTMPLQDFQDFINYRLDCHSPLFFDLKGKHFATDTAVTPVVDLLATKYRTKREVMKEFTALHMVVVTLRCNQHCHYCHASSQPEDQLRWDMSHETAVNVVEKIMSTPSVYVKIEFQGGEALLNLDVVKTIVREAKRLNKVRKKDLSFVLCTNLTLMDRPILEYLKEEGVSISTSLDGPRDIHDRHRVMRQGGGSYDLFMKNLRLVWEIMGEDQASPLVTLSRESLPRIREVIDEYVRHHFPGIFLRGINPYGYARQDTPQRSFSYRTDEFLEAYKKGLLYLIELNLKGHMLVENYSAILLSRILTPFATGFVDLQSPTGAGIGGAIYDYNGDVYPCDEGRMLAKMGDRRFFLGNVNRDYYLDIFTSPVLQELIEKSCVETIPGCHSCAYQVYCGADPVKHYTTQGDLMGHRPTSDFCRKNKAAIEFLLEIIDAGDPGVMDVFWSWITNRPLGQVRGEIP